jgi:plastocyanin
VKVVFIVFLILFTLSTGLLFNNAFATVPSNSVFTLEGSGFAVTEETIKISKIDLALSTEKQTGSTIKSLIKDAFFTFDDAIFQGTELDGTLLREGKYIRIDGIIENESGNEASVKIFGKLIEESKDGSIYGFTGKITTKDQEYKIIYTSKLSKLVKINITPTDSKNIQKNLTIHILKGSSTQGADSYIGLPLDSTKFKYFSQDRISISPGTTIIFVNDDLVSHNILSGKENYYDRYNQFTPDGRISSGVILPGKSISVTLDEKGFYRLYDPNFQWMKIVAYVFPDVDNVILGQGKNSGN